MTSSKGERRGGHDSMYAAKGTAVEKSGMSNGWWPREPRSAFNATESS